MITIFLVLASVHKCQTGFSLANISFTRNENASWSTFFKGHWSQDISKEIKFTLLCSFSKTIPKWPVILPKDLLIFIWYAVIAVNYLYYCFEYVFGFCIFYLSVAYLLPRQLLIPPYLVYRHPYIVFICLIWLCLHAFWCFHYSFIKYYVFNSKLLCACNRCCVVDPYDLSPTLCDSNTTSIC